MNKNIPIKKAFGTITLDDFVEQSILHQRIYSVFKRKTIFTPEEVSNKYIDQETSEYLGDYLMSSATILPNNDVLIGFRSTYIDVEIVDHEYHNSQVISKRIEYYKLSEIDIADITVQFNKELNNDKEEEDKCEEQLRKIFNLPLNHS